MEQKIKVTKLIPAVVVRYVESGNIYLITSSCLYEDSKNANEAMCNLLKLYIEDKDYEVIRCCTFKKSFSLSFDI